jgi:ABC-type uncharacterized transport system involved in gliding motility auxiliary subunit
MAMMKSRLKRFAPGGLYLSLAAFLLSAGLYIVQREFTLWLQISLGLVLVGLAVFAILDPEQVRIAFTGRQVRYGSNTAIMTFAFVGIVVVVNYLVYHNPERWDLTENQQYTLAPESLEAINRLPGTVKVLAFYTPQLNNQQAERLLDQYKFHSRGRIDYEFIDPNVEFSAAQQYNISRDGTLVLILGENQEQVTLVDEREITGALLRLISPGERKIYFLTGHGEFDPEETGENSYSQIKSLLESKNYIVEKLNLMAQNQIPADTNAIVIAGPKISLAEQEVQVLSSFLESGGALIVMLEPLPLTEVGDGPDVLADYLETKWGITMGKDLVVDLTSNQPFFAVSNQYGDHIITEKLSGILTIFPTARSVTTDSSVTQALLLDLILTSQQSWAESDLAAFQNQDSTDEAPQIQFDEGVDTLGPITIAAVVDDSTTQARMVVFGDADFASDRFYNQFGNSDLFVNSVDWVAQREELLNLTPKEDITRLLVPPGRYTLNLILLGSVFILPGTILVAGIIVWIQRRRRG